MADGKIPANAFSPAERDILRKALATYEKVCRRAVNNAAIDAVKEAQREEADKVVALRARF